MTEYMNMKPEKKETRKIKITISNIKCERLGVLNVM